MKKAFLALALIVSVMALSAQSYTVTDPDGTVVESGATYNVFGLGNDWGELSIEFNVTANENVRLIGEKVENNVIEGTSNYFCWGQCLSPTIFISDPFQMEPQQSEVFSMHFIADDYMTVLSMEQSMTYYLYEPSNPDDKFVINVIFKYSMDGVNDINAVEEFSNAYPMPASSVVNFDYSFNSSVNSAMIAIYNMMGQEVMRSEISGMSGRHSLNISDLADGVYFYSLIVNGVVEKSNKLIVRR